MADDKPGSTDSTAGANRGRRRPAPTIDLTATEVSAAEPAEAAKAPALESAPSETATTPEATTPSGSEPHADTVAAAEASPEAPAAEAAQPQAPEPDAATSPPPPPLPSPSRVWPATLGSAVGGAAIVAIALWYMWGIPPRSDDAGQQTKQLAALETTVRELAGRVPPASDANKLALLTERVGKLETATGTGADPALAGKISDTDKQVAALTRELALLKQNAAANAAAIESAQRTAAAAAAKAETVQAADAQEVAVDRRDLAALGVRLTKLESAAQALQNEIAQQKSALAQQQAALAKQAENQRAERAVRLAVVAEALKAAVAGGDRFRRELDAAKALAPNKEQLAPLEAFADTGVPSATALGQQLRATVPAMRRAAAPKAATEGSFLDRLQINAERLVRIQPIEERRGDDAGAILTRVDAKAARGDIAGVLVELKALPAEARAPAENWIKTAQAREAAIDASRGFAAAYVGALAGRAE
jgi:hypothetical protein